MPNNGFDFLEDKYIPNLIPSVAHAWGCSNALDWTNPKWFKLFKANISLANCYHAIQLHRSQYSIRDKFSFGEITSLRLMQYTLGILRAWVTARES